MRLAVLHGPNPVRLCKRDSAKYGSATLDDITRTSTTPPGASV
jgi:3-dehydroquinate dehydratase